MPLPRPGFWNDQARTDIPVGSTGDAGLDRLNTFMPLGTEFGSTNLGGGMFGTPGTARTPGRAGPAPAQPMGVQRQAVPSPAQAGRRRAVRRKVQGLRAGGYGG